MKAWVVVGVACVGLAGCGDAGTSAAPDTMAYTLAPDTVADGTEDASPDTVPDTVPDTAPDTAPDTVPDKAPDTVPQDTAPDTVPQDTAPDTVPQDTAPDTGPPDTVPQDTAPDTVPQDTAPDTGPPDTVPQDTAPDTGPDVTAGDVGDPCELDADCVSDACGPDGVCCEPNPCGTCGPAPLEVCNGLDDDCDGATDELAVCDACDGALYTAAFSAGEAATDLRVGWEWQIVRLGTAHNAVLSVEQDGVRNAVIVGAGGVKSWLLDGYLNGPGGASDDTSRYLAWLRDPGDGVPVVQAARYNGATTVLHLNEQVDVAPDPHATPVAVGGFALAYAYVNAVGELVVVQGSTWDADPAVWTKATVAAEADPGVHVVVTPGAVAHALWRADGGTGAVRHWSGEELTGPGVSGIEVLDAAAGPDESVHAAWVDSTAGDLQYARWDAAGWGPVETVGASVAPFSAVAVSPEGRVLAARQASATEVVVSERGPTGWLDIATRTLATGPDVLERIELAATEGGVLWLAAVVVPLTGTQAFAFTSACGGHPDVCVPDCGSLACGADGCGGVCGQCGDDELCNDKGKCVSSCVPDCVGKICGDNGCGKTCGTCLTGWTCESGWCEPPDVPCGEDPAASCQDRCGEPYNAAAACQCMEECVVFGDCCDDVGTCCGP